MNSSKEIEKLNNGLKNIELLLRNIEFKKDPAEGHRPDWYTIGCDGEIIKINNFENKKLFTVGGVGGKLEMTTIPENIASCVIGLHFLEQSDPRDKHYTIFEDRFDIQLDLPLGIVRNINKEINKSFSKDGFKINLIINFIEPITEVYNRNAFTISEDDKVILYLGETYEDDDSNYGLSGKVNIQLTISCNKPYSMIDETEVLFSFTQ